MVNADKGTPDESMTGVTMVYTDNGVQRAILNTPLIYKYGTQQGRTEFPKGLTVDFFTKEGKKESFIKSGYAILNDMTQQFILEKHVEMINYIRKDTLNTEYLVWKKDSAIVTTDRQIYIHGPKGKFWGHHFKGNENFTKYRFTKVKMEYFYNETDSL